MIPAVQNYCRLVKRTSPVSETRAVIENAGSMIGLVGSVGLLSELFDRRGLTSEIRSCLCQRTGNRETAEVQEPARSYLLG